VASSRTRARKLAREKLDRQLARRADVTRRNRRIRAGVGAGLSVILVGLGATWLLGGFDPEPEPAAAPVQCVWQEQNLEANTDLKQVGTPPTSGLPETGTAAMTLTLNTGAVQIALDQANSPCAAASIGYLAGKQFYDNTSCFELQHAKDVYSLTCGDPSASGKGGPSYAFANELTIPLADPAASPSASPSASASAAADTLTLKAGTVAMLPNVSGSQFVIFYKDSKVEMGKYSLVGQVSGGLDIVSKIAAAGTVANASGADTKPKSDVKIQTVAVVPGTEQPPATTPSSTPAATPSTKS
jgi:peptidyl-prolyl cis-trans isomerase B (cyclophilin B)